MVNAEDVDYPYARSDLLEQRNDYFYSAFHGPAFLDAWRASRKAAADLLDQAETGSLPGDGETRPSPTLLHLHALRERLAAGTLDSAQRSTLDRLVQRFEVSKRLHAAYDDAFKPLDAEDYRDLRLYVAFAEVLAAAAARSARLSYLNALLKCMDILAGAAACMPASQRTRARELLLVEDDLVRRVQHAAGGMAGC